MKFAIVGGSPKSLLPDLKSLQKEGYLFIGVDKGFFYLYEENIEVEAIFGDFDSIPKEIMMKIAEDKKTFRFSPIKNESDTELALSWCCEQKPEEILLLGMTGGRLDHEWCNLGLMRRIQKQYRCKISIVDHCNEITLYNSGSYEISNNPYYSYISFLPFSESVRGISLQNFAYDLEKTDIEWGTTLTVSNEFIGETGSFSFEEGIIMVIRSRDNEK